MPVSDATDGAATDSTATDDGGDTRAETAVPFTVEDLPWLAGLVVGVATYALAYVLVGGLFALDLSANLSLDGGPLPDSTLSYLGWVFYSAHLVTVDVSLFSFNLVELAAVATTLPPAAYYSLPPLLLVGGGLALVRWHGAAGAAPGRRALAGAMLVGGYLPAMVVGAVAVATPEGQPDVALAFGYGLAYAVVFGGLGGLLAGR